MQLHFEEFEKHLRLRREIACSLRRFFTTVVLVAIFFSATVVAYAIEPESPVSAPHFDVSSQPDSAKSLPANDQAKSVSAKPTFKADPKWETDLDKGNLVLPKLIQAISGRTNSDETQKLLRGVVKITRDDDSFKLIREDSKELNFGPDTMLGDRMIQSLERTRRDTDKYGQNLGEVMAGLKGVSVAGNHVELLREGPPEVRIAVAAAKKSIPIKLKEVRLSRLSMDLDESRGYPAVRNINGIEVIVSAGVDFHIKLKEFSRTKNARGDTMVTFGIINPLPKALRIALGLKEITYFSHTVRKKVERSA